jgi:hypothetical protein
MAFDEGFNSINTSRCNLHVYKYLNNCMFQEEVYSCSYSLSKEKQAPGRPGESVQLSVFDMDPECGHCISDYLLKCSLVHVKKNRGISVMFSFVLLYRIFPISNVLLIPYQNSQVLFSCLASNILIGDN